MFLLALGSGSAGGYLLILALAPVLTRLYTPADFGLFGVFGAVYAVLSIVVTLGYDQAIVGARRLPEALRLSAVTHYTAAILIVLMLVLTVPAEWLLPADLDIGLLALALAVIVCWLTVFGQVATSFAVRRRQSARAGAGTFVNLAGRSLFQVGFGVWLGGGLYGLIAGEFLGRLAGYLVVETGVTVKAFRRILAKPAAVVADMRRNRTFPLYIMPAMTLDVVLVWAPAPLFTFAYGPVAGGLLVLVQRLGSAPLTIINQSLGQLFHLEASRAMFSQPRRVLRWFLAIVAVSVPALVLLMVVLEQYGEPFFAMLFGAEWSQAGHVAVLWAPLFYAQFLALLTNRLIIVMNHMHIRLVSSIANIVLMVVAIVAASQAGFDYAEAMMLMVGLLTISYLTVIGVVLVRVARFVAA